MADETDEAAEAFLAKILEEVQRLSLEYHAEVITADKVVANSVFWLKIVSEFYEPLIPYIAALVGSTVLRGERVDASNGTLPKRLVN